MLFSILHGRKNKKIAFLGIFLRKHLQCRTKRRTFEVEKVLRRKVLYNLFISINLNVQTTKKK